MPRHPTPPVWVQRWLLVMALLPLLGCVGGAAIVSQQSVSTGMSSRILPRWVCPSPTPLPTRTTSVPGPDGTPTVTSELPWEQEYGLPPVTPTPYYRDATTFVLGQTVELGDGLFVTPSVTATALVTPDTTLMHVTLAWTNMTTSPIALNPARQVVISSITRPAGGQVAGPWLWTPAASQAAGAAPDAAALVTTIPQGASPMHVPILTPAGTVAVLDLRLDAPGATDTASAGGLRVQFTPGDVTPPCPSSGLIGTTLPEPRPTVVGVAPPPGTDGIVASALAQVGRQYCWGGKGYQPCDGYGGGAVPVTPACADYPCFDCSGLTWWAYHDNGIPIGHGTANQQHYPVVALAEATDGDLALFSNINGAGRAGITHVGLLADVNQDGKLDMIHASKYPDGVVIAYDVFAPGSWYRQYLVIITRPPRASGANAWSTL